MSELTLAPAPLQARWLIVPMGPPGAGKSRLASALARTLGWPLLDRDAIRVELGADWNDAGKAAAEALWWRRIGSALHAGYSLILDGKCFTRRQQREALDALAADCSARVLWLWIDVPVAVAAARVSKDAAAQAHPARDRTPGLVHALAAAFEVPHSALRLDGEAAPAVLLQAALSAVAEALRERK